MHFPRLAALINALPEFVMYANHSELERGDPHCSTVFQRWSRSLVHRRSRVRSCRPTMWLASHVWETMRYPGNSAVKMNLDTWRTRSAHWQVSNCTRRATLPLALQKLAIKYLATLTTCIRWKMLLISRVNTTKTKIALKRELPN